MSWASLFSGKKKPQSPDNEAHLENTPELSDHASILLRAHLVQPVLEDLKVEADLFRRSLGYKSYFPEMDNGERWFELGALNLSPEDKQEKHANGSWYQGGNIDAMRVWFDAFISRHDFWHIVRKYSDGEPITNELFTSQEEITPEMQKEYDLCVQKTMEWMEAYFQRAEEYPNSRKPLAQESLNRLHNIVDRFKEITDLQKPLKLPVLPEPLDENKISELQQENDRLLKYLREGKEKLLELEMKAGEYLKLLGYQIDPRGEEERNALQSFDDALAYSRRVEADREDDLPKEKTDHDYAVKWRNCIKCIHHAAEEYGELHDQFTGYFAPDLTPKNLETLQRLVAFHREDATRYLDSFFAAVVDEERLDNPKVFETLTELKKLQMNFAESYPSASRSAFRS